MSSRIDNRKVPVANTRCLPTSIIFDLDGTLLNTIGDMTDAVNAALDQRGYPTRSVEEVKYLVGEGTETFARGALPSEAHEPGIITGLIDEYRAEYAKVWTRKTRPYPGIPLKPDPGAALRLAKCLGNAPEHVLFVGDTKTDMQTARSAGMVAVGALWGFRTAEELRQYGAKHLIRRPSDILDLPEWKAGEA